MYTDTEGIIFKQVKTLNGRRMLMLFSDKYGKINAGTSISDKGKGKSSLALKPFTRGRYEMYKNRDSYNINSAEVLQSFYGIGEDIDKYISSSYVLEFTEKILPEEVPAPKIFELLLAFLGIIEKRKSKYDSLVVAYQIKVLQYSGFVPIVNHCTSCDEEKEQYSFDIASGGLVCDNCLHSMKLSKDFNVSLIYDVDFAIINVMKYILGNPIKSFTKLAIEDVVLNQLKRIMKAYCQYHFDIGELKSEDFIL